MNFSIPIGQYIPKASIIHELDPRLKLVTAFIFMFLIFFLPHLPSLFGAFVFLAIVIGLSKISIIYVLCSLRVIWLILLLSFFIHIFLTRDGNVIFQWSIFTIYDEGFRQGLLLIARLSLIVIAASLLTLTTKPLVLTNGLTYLMKPLKKIGFPVHECALMITIALRFIPTLLQETEKIMKAQQARGANFYRGNIIKRVPQYISIFIPLIVSSFQRAEELALAMEARAYRGEVGRTQLHQLKFDRRDTIAICIIVAWFFLIIAGRWWV